VVERADRAKSHADGRELPEVGHQPRVRVAAEACPITTDLAAELLEIGFVEATLEECACVDSGRCVALEVDVIASVAIVLTAEEVVEADLVQARRARKCAEVAADSVLVLVGAHDHHGRVPAHECPNAPLDVLVAGEPRLGLARDGVDIRRADGCGEADLCRVGVLEQLAQQEPGACLAVNLDDGIEAFHPLLGFARVAVGELADVAVEDHLGILSPLSTNRLRCRRNG